MAHQTDNFDDDIELEDEDTQKDRYLTFRLAPEEYGVEIRYVTEIVGIQKITDVPDTEEYIRGVINLRGKIIPVIDVRTRFHLEPKEYADRTCIIVVDVSGTNVGLIVDEVLEVVNIPEAQVSEPPRTSKGSQSKYIQGIGKIGESVKILLNIDRILNDEEMMSFQQMA